MECTSNVSTSTNDFGRYLRELRLANGMTLEDLEVKCGVSSTYLSRIEIGSRRPPSARILNTLASVLDADILVLLAKAGYVEKKTDTNVAKSLPYLLETETISYKDRILSNLDRQKLLIALELIL